MESSNDKNKRIAKNTLFLYARMLISLIISLFTARVILETLGVKDYGVYNVVGGVVAMFTFINSSMAGATSRFLNYEMGKDNKTELNTVFNCALLIHIGLALLIIAVAETIGLWFLNHKLVIPQDSIYAANWVYQLSIASAFLSITQAPYQASVIAEEKMSIYAYFDISNTILKLLIVYLLIVIPGNKLIIYGILTFALSALYIITYRLYCIKKFPYCRISFSALKGHKVKKMLSFSGWDLYGNMSVMARTQGISMLANIFFGTIANAAIGIANSLQAALNGFATNVTLAMKPQIIKSYASGEYEYMQKLLFRGAKFSFLILLTLSLPVLIETPFILKLWLGEIPEYTVWISRWTIAFIFFSNMSYVLVTGVHATGNVKGPSLINGTLYLLVIPITYIAYKYNLSIYTPFILNVLFVFIGSLMNLIYTKKYVQDLSLKVYITHVLGPCLMVMVLSAVLPILINYTLSSGWLRFGIVTITSIICSIVFGFYFAMNKSERAFALTQVKKILQKFKN